MKHPHDSKTPTSRAGQRERKEPTGPTAPSKERATVAPRQRRPSASRCPSDTPTFTATRLKGSEKGGARLGVVLLPSRTAASPTHQPRAHRHASRSWSACGLPPAYSRAFSLYSHTDSPSIRSKQLSEPFLQVLAATQAPSLSARKNKPPSGTQPSGGFSRTNIRKRNI